MMRMVVVTGASTGIGRAVVARLVADGCTVGATVRSARDAEGLTAEFGDRVLPLVADVTEPAQLQAAADRVCAQLGQATLAGLVVNAGIAVGGPLLAQPDDEVRRTFEVNVFGALATVRAFAPLLGTEPGRVGAPGRIVTIGSVSGWMALPFLGAYAASKHALKALTEALRGELAVHGIDAVIVEPGPVVTPIWEKAIAQDPARYDGTAWSTAVRRFAAFSQQQGAQGLPASAVADAVADSLTARQPPVRRVVVRARLLNFTIPRLLPTRLFERVVAQMLGLARG